MVEGKPEWEMTLGKGGRAHIASMPSLPATLVRPRPLALLLLLASAPAAWAQATPVPASSGNPASAAVAEPDARVFHLRLRQHRFVPPDLAVPAGTRLHIILENEDDQPEEFDSHALNREKHLAPHAKVHLYVGPLAPGRYGFEGENHGDPDAVARGALVAR
jgi:hypothetical protein